MVPLLASLCGLAGLGAAGPDAPIAPGSRGASVLEEQVEVRRIQVEVRAVDREGVAIRGLTADDFVVRFGGRDARVEAADWIEGSAGEGDPSGPWEEGGSSAPTRGIRRVVLLFQRSLNPTRVPGLMRMVPAAESIVEALGPDDEIAILTFGRRLELFTDFTRDRARVLDILRDSIVDYRPPPGPEPGAEPRLARLIDAAAERETAHAEDALKLLAEALGGLPGQHTIVWLGHGMGVRSAGSILTRRSFREALVALRDTGIPVFTLDLTQADYHSLEAPLIRAARATGGFYAKTHRFARFAAERVARVLEGRYVLTIAAAPDGRRDVRELRVRLRGRDGTVYHPDTVRSRS